MVDIHLNRWHVAILLPWVATPKSIMNLKLPLSNLSLFDPVRSGNFSSEGAKQSFITFVVHSVISFFRIRVVIGHLDLVEHYERA